MSGLSELIDALTLLRKYGDPTSPTHCEHDTLMICGIEPSQVSEEDTAKLEEMGFIVGNEFGEEAFISYRYGSA